MHIVILPLSVVVAAFLVIELALAIPHAIALIAFVPAAILVLLDDIVLLVIGLDGCGFLADLGYGAEWLVLFVAILGRGGFGVLWCTSASIVMGILLFLFWYWLCVLLHGLAVGVLLKGFPNVDFGLLMYLFLTGA